MISIYKNVNIYGCEFDCWLLCLLDAELLEHHVTQVNAARAEFSNTNHGTQGIRRGDARAAGLWLWRPISHVGQQILPKAPQANETDGVAARGKLKKFISQKFQRPMKKSIFKNVAYLETKIFVLYFCSA